MEQCDQFEKRQKWKFGRVNSQETNGTVGTNVIGPQFNSWSTAQAASMQRDHAGFPGG